MAEEQRQKEKMNRILMTVLFCITVLAVGIAVRAVYLRKPKVILAPDHAPAVEANAEAIEETDKEKLEQPEGGGAVSLKYSPEVTITKKPKKAKLLFANPSRSNQDLILQIVIQDTVIVQSGLLKPGNQVTDLDIPDTSMLKTGTYEGSFVIYYYYPENGEKAIVNSEMPIHVTVIEK